MPATVQTDQLVDGHASMQIERCVGPEEAVTVIASHRLFVFPAAGFHGAQEYDYLKQSSIGETSIEKRRGENC